jgi:hypothetical protein
VTSAPCASSGTSTGITLPRAFDIFSVAPSSVSPVSAWRGAPSPKAIFVYGITRPLASRYVIDRIMPWLISRWNGSAVETWPRSNSTLCQKREYSRCSTACSAPPT